MDNSKYSTNPDFDFEDLDQLMEEQESSWEYWYEYSNQRFIELIARALKKNKIAKKELAKKMGVQPSYISKILADEHNVEFKTMARLAFALDKYLDFDLKDLHQPSLIEGGNLHTISFKSVPNKTFWSGCLLDIDKPKVVLVEKMPDETEKRCENDSVQVTNSESTNQKGCDSHGDLALAA